MIRHFFIVFLFLLAPAQAENCCLATKGVVPLQTEIIAQGFDHPWGMAFLPDGSLLVTERKGQLRRVVAGKISKPFKGLPAVAEIGQGGLLDIAIDPDFATNNRIFFSFAQPSSTRTHFSTAVARARLDINAGRLRDVAVIFSANNKSRGGRHFGSRIVFASDKTLYVTLGDRGTQMRAQHPFDHAGSVIRIARDGSVPPDNPFANGQEAQPEIWSLGHRNAQGAALHPNTKKLWTVSHGAAGGDEINVPHAGQNYGWPLISYGQNYSGLSFAQGTHAQGLQQPIYYWDPSIAPSGMSFYAPRNPKIPDWQNSLLVGALRGQHLARLMLNGERIIGEEVYFVGEFGRIRDVRSGPDGAAWLLTDDDPGKLVRITQKE
ncbi:MAG: PQQ-dependent sugar dehydrogenase [Pseudomonadota bacterium]